MYAYGGRVLAGSDWKHAVERPIGYCENAECPAIRRRARWSVLGVLLCGTCLRSLKASDLEEAEWS